PQPISASSVSRTERAQPSTVLPWPSAPAARPSVIWVAWGWALPGTTRDPSGSSYSRGRGSKGPPPADLDTATPPCSAAVAVARPGPRGAGRPRGLPAAGGTPPGPPALASLRGSAP